MDWGEEIDWTPPRLPSVKISANPSIFSVVSDNFGGAHVVGRLVDIIPVHYLYNSSHNNDYPIPTTGTHEIVDLFTKYMSEIIIS